jgi:DNA repair protein RAD5
VVEGAEDGAADNAEGATVSKYQLQDLYASAAAACATIPEADAPAALKTTLRPYQRQALHWMLARETPHDEEEEASAVKEPATDAAAAAASASGAAAAVDGGSPVPAAPAAAAGGAVRRKHPLWDEYSLADAEETPFYVNAFSNELSLDFPPAKGSCRGGILADEMGMGKTVMAIALILANHPANVLLDEKENEEVKAEDAATAAPPAAIEAAAGGSKDADIEIMDEDSAPAAAASTGAAASSAAASMLQVPAAGSASSSSSFFDSAKTSRARHRRSYMLRDGVCGATLVVCPMSLLSQWRDEITRFAGPEALDVLVYYGGGKDRRSNSKIALHEFDVVLTSYGVLASEHRAVQAAQNAANSAALAAGRAFAPLSERQLSNLSPLLSTTFWRLLLDEGHIIRNRSTETARSTFALRGVRRWVISGTIIQNKIDDVYAPLRFLGEEPWASWGWWNSVISQPFAHGNEVALQRLRAILSPLMLRRTKAMRNAAGDSIVELPPKTEEVLYCDFSDKEEQFYKAIYTKSKAQFEGFGTGRCAEADAASTAAFFSVQCCVSYRFSLLCSVIVCVFVCSQ